MVDDCIVNSNLRDGTDRRAQWRFHDAIRTQSGGLRPENGSARKASGPGEEAAVIANNATPRKQK